MYTPHDDGDMIPTGRTRLSRLGTANGGMRVDRSDIWSRGLKTIGPTAG